MGQEESAGRRAGQLGPDLDLPRLRRELTGYLSRLVVHPQSAEDLVQETFVRALAAQSTAPTVPDEYRYWIFRIASNLAMDWLRRERRRRRYDIQTIREDAENDPAFVERSRALIGTPETELVAHEHLAACFACTLSNLPERQAMTLLLVEVHGFSVQEAADALTIPFNAAKNALQDGRRSMTGRYQQTCALIAKEGVCHQCSELAHFFRAKPVTLPGGRSEARMERLRELRDRRPGLWHTLLLGRLPTEEPPGD